MKYTDFLHSTAREIDEELDRFFMQWEKETGRVSPHLVPLMQTLHEACQGGKRIRGSLIKCGFLLQSGKPTTMRYNHEILKIALAYELFQTAILVHDDIIDKSLQRRGKPTVYQQLGGDHYGISQAICLGDLGFFQASHLIADSRFDDTVKNKALAFFSEHMRTTVFGEMLDITLSRKNVSFTEADIIAIYRLKTAFYTFIAPLSIGAILDGASEHELRLMKTYGEHVGIMYQIQDDMNDIFGKPEKMKKERGADIKEGKATLLYLKALTAGTPKQRAILQKYYGNARIGPEAIEEVKELFLQTGAVEYAEKLVAEHARKAREVIPLMTKDTAWKEMLLDLVELVAEKKYYAKK